MFFEVVERVFDCFVESVDSDMDALDGMRALLAGASATGCGGKEGSFAAHMVYNNKEETQRSHLSAALSAS